MLNSSFIVRVHLRETSTESGKLSAVKLFPSASDQEHVLTQRVGAAIPNDVLKMTVGQRRVGCIQIPLCVEYEQIDTSRLRVDRLVIRIDRYRVGASLPP